MRRLAGLALIALLAAACGADPQATVVTSDGGGGGESAEQPEGEPAEPEPEPETEPRSEPAPDLAALLLTAEDVPLWEHTGPMDFGAEPGIEAADCELMNQAWAANTYPGTRTRASTQGATLRNTVVELEDEATAAAVLDAADRVWEECAEVAATIGLWWVEPIRVPDAGMRSSGLVLGDDDLTAWVIAYWQQDNVIYLLELNGDRTFDYVQSVLTAAAGRLTGEPAPVPELPEPGTRPEPPTPVPAPRITPETDIAVPPVDPPSIVPAEPDWREHELARFVPDTSELGDGWTIDSADVTEYAPAESNEELEACGLAEPPTLDGIEVSYVEGLDDAGDTAFIVNRGSVPDVQSFVDLFRSLPNCEPADLGISDADMVITTEPITVEGADEAIITRFAGSFAGGDLNAAYVVARYSDLLLAMTSASSEEGGGEPALSVEELVVIIERAAARS